MAEIKELIGKTLRSIFRADDELIFNTTDDIQYKMLHYSDCCESVTIDDIIGDLNDLVGTPIISAEESQNSDDGKGHDSHTWTFYKLATNKGYVTIRWYGSSNGYYSESVSFVRT